jgi:hypothetical protein
MTLGEWDTPDPAPTTPGTTAAGAAPLVARIVTDAITDRLADIVVPVVDEALADILADPNTVDQLQAGARAAINQLLAEPPPDPGLRYRSVDEFVRDLVIPVFRRNIGPRAEHRWSARWWESAEAIMRLDAMWRAWEALRHDPATGISGWLRDHADHHMTILLSPTGPFARSQDEAKTTDPLPYTPPPDGLFPPA